MQTAFFRSIILYIVVVIVMRLMGKRQLGELEPSEFAVTVMISELATIPMQDSDIPLLHGIIPILAIISLEFIMTFLSLKSIRFRTFSCGKPSILIREGTIDQKELKRVRISIDELMSALRNKNATDISKIRYAILEPGGQLSVINYEDSSPVTPKMLDLYPNEAGIPFTLISDGNFIESNLERRGVDRDWVEHWLRRHGKPEPGKIFLLTLDDAGNVFCVERNTK